MNPIQRVSSGSHYNQSRAHCLGLDIRLLTSNVGLELEKLQSRSNVLAQVFLGIETELGAIALVALNVQTDGSATAASTGQTHDNAAAIIELEVKTLVLGDTAVKVSVREVAGIDNLATIDLSCGGALGNHVS